jgi:hypothetical protein
MATFRTSSPANATSLSILLRGEPEFLRAWTERWSASRLALSVGVILAGAGLYGAAMGWWRSPLQALFVAAKFPLILLLVVVFNALLNAMLAPLLGLNISFRQSLLAILTSFTIASAILGAFSPLAAFLVWNTPALTPELEHAGSVYGFVKVVHVVIIAFAGTVSNLRLLQLLRALSPNGAVARRVLLAWLAGNLFLGSQLTWILRPFIGSPGLPVQFLREKALEGNFYENLLHTVLQLIGAR